MALTLAAAARTDKAAHRPNETDAGDGVIPVDADGIPPLAGKGMTVPMRGRTTRQAEWYRGSNDFALVSAGAFSGFETTGVFLCSTHIGKQSEPHKLYSNPSLSQRFCQACFKKPRSPVSPKNKYDSK